ncbi:hypothetical protein ALT_2061 [Aspergillus lentulus]|uniref:Uncharacterized protein n=1 Tax=Aspergillus lentulus TaxID=293939 RepID=A0AAN5YJV2_ASPLE|nr:hypothetical protein CNMCM6069_000111 [Aspergillus lentulus]KAF4163966.1 hypothetical protein CNMCM6936_000067 [Aspergillus lentulus]KAF4175932.1 hypothetical protein CNMCM8060_006777 [Aspergillus lentulus]KAF4181029.1 hypothetical protein CNMCM7927_000836 [Aspergillus lentulus]KAF4190296.1 hypothetical protein CNMCM8694_003765 [Aspergillus lentulus]
MPSNTGETNDELSNDYVAEVLAKEARDSSMKYSAQGLGAYLPRRPTGAAPKPNTRFLRNIIKETDSHNAALKRKEEREARERMRQLRGQASSSSANDAKERDQEAGNQGIALIGEAIGVVQLPRTEIGPADTDEPIDLTTMVKGVIDLQGKNIAAAHTHEAALHEMIMPRILAIATDNVDARSHCRPLAAHHQTDTGVGKVESIQDTTLAAAHSMVARHVNTPQHDLVGPLPPRHDVDSDSGAIRSRGRGAYKANLSNIDAHFAPDYDPTLDVHMEDDDQDQGKGPSRRPVAGLTTEEDDWELALEALRDRARWKQKGAERLREAGFNDDVVDRWKSTSSKTATGGGDDEGRLEDVKWSKKGEGREWDRGKFVNDDGHIDVKASW